MPAAILRSEKNCGRRNRYSSQIGYQSWRNNRRYSSWTFAIKQIASPVGFADSTEGRVLRLGEVNAKNCDDP